jgi:putative oxygen-independent coproporphyrinogen III oxidase
MRQKIALYVHWPFCKSKCPYCDFNSHVRENIDSLSWCKAYLNEIEYYAPHLVNKELVSIFFGGGTPSLMPSFIIKEILDKLRSITYFSETIEITLEANPTSVESEKFAAFSEAGVNRVSLGIQSLDQNDLKFLGRGHTAEEAIGAIEIAKKYFKRYSFDLIYALPNQNLTSWESQLRSALKLVGDHISLYQLTIEKGTAFYSDYKNKKLKIPGENLAKDFYLLTQEIMNDHKLPAYEISNHATIGQECRHNLIYWKYDDFIGIGPGAHGRINNKAISNVYHPENWLNSVLQNNNAIQHSLELTFKEQLYEILLMGLRLNSGINQEEFIQKMGNDFHSLLNIRELDVLLKNGFLNFENNYLYASSKGKLVLNKIIDMLVE